MDPVLWDHGANTIACRLHARRRSASPPSRAHGGCLRSLFGVTRAERHKDEHYADYPPGFLFKAFALGTQSELGPSV